MRGVFGLNTLSNIMIIRQCYLLHVLACNSVNVHVFYACRYSVLMCMLYIVMKMAILVQKGTPVLDYPSILIQNSMCKFNFLAPVSLSMPHTGLFSQNYCFLPLDSFFAGETTIAKKTVKRTTFPNGTFSYEVEMFVTPAILVRRSKLAQFYSNLQLL